MEKGQTMTLEERVNRMSLKELRQELAKARVRQMKEVVERVLPSKASERAKIQKGISHLDYSIERLAPELKVNVTFAEPMFDEEVRPEMLRCPHLRLRRAKWVPGPFAVGETKQWMVPMCCSDCGELIRKFVEVK